MGGGRKAKPPFAFRVPFQGRNEKICPGSEIDSLQNHQGENKYKKILAVNHMGKNKTAVVSSEPRSKLRYQKWVDSRNHRKEIPRAESRNEPWQGERPLLSFIYPNRF